MQGRRSDGDAGARRDESSAQDEERVLRRVDPRSEDGLAVVEEQAVAERGEPRASRADAQGPGPLGLGRAAQRPVEGVGDDPGRAGHVGEEQVGVGVAEQRRRGVVVLAAEAVAAAAGHDVDGVPDVKKALVCRVDGSVWTVGEPGRGQRPQDRHVPQPAPGLLEVWLDEVSEVSLAGVPGQDALVQLRQPGPGVGPPVVCDGGPGRVDDLLVAGEEGDVQEADGSREVGAGDGPALVHGADAVVEPHPLVPDGIPEPVGQGVELGRAERSGLVEQDEVVVAERATVTAGQAPDRGEGHPGDPAALTGLGPQPAEPVEAEVGEGGPSRRTGTGSREVPSAGQVEPPGGDVGHGSRCPSSRAAGFDSRWTSLPGRPLDV